jgi:putative addiction module component (TIGR02574 family)
MTKGLKDVLAAARQLSDEEQNELVRQLLELDESMLSDDELLTDELKAELDRRVAHSEAHPETLIPLEEARRRARAELLGGTAE